MSRLGWLAGLAATGALLAFGAPAQAQLRASPEITLAQAPQGYVPPRVLRKQREMQQRVWQKYGIPPQGVRQYDRRRYDYREDYRYGPRAYGPPPGYGRPSYGPPPGYGRPYYGPPQGYGRRYDRYEY